MNFAIVGMRGNAKTPLARHMADKAPLRVIFDPTPNRKNFPRRAHQSFATTPDGARAAIATLGAVEENDDDAMAFAAAIRAPGFPGATIDEVLIAPTFDVDETFTATCDALITWLDEYRESIAAPGVAFVVDECWSVSERVMPQFFDHLARAADLSKFQLIVTAHSPVDVSPQLRRIVQVWCLFQMVDKRDLDAIRERCGDDVAAALPTLGVAQFVLFKERPRRSWDIRTGFPRMRD